MYEIVVQKLYDIFVVVKSLIHCCCCDNFADSLVNLFVNGSELKWDRKYKFLYTNFTFAYNIGK